MNIDFADLTLIQNGLILLKKEMLNDPFGKQHPEILDRYVNKIDNMSSMFNRLIYDEELVIHVKD